MTSKLEAWKKYFKDLETWIKYKFDSKFNKPRPKPVNQIRVIVQTPELLSNDPHGIRGCIYDTGWRYLPPENEVIVKHFLEEKLCDLDVQVYLTINEQPYKPISEDYRAFQINENEIRVKMIQLFEEDFKALCKS